MRFYDFEHIMSTERLQKYVDACNGDTRKAMTLYRLNLKASQEMFTVVSCFEVALRNAIDYILYLFNELDKVNSLRNRIAHHEPIIFVPGNIHADTSYILNEYQKIQALFMWMGIDSHSLLFGLDHVINVCQEIQNITINQNKNKS